MRIYIAPRFGYSMNAQHDRLGAPKVTEPREEKENKQIE